MSHEAMLSRGQSGEWVVYFTAKRVAATGKPAAGLDADTIHGTSHAELADGQVQLPGRQSRRRLAGSDVDELDDHAAGLLVVVDADPVFDPLASFSDNYCAAGSPSCGLRRGVGLIDANFNGVINDDGSFVGLWRTWECSGDLRPENGYATYGTSTDLEGGQACFSVPHPVVASDWKTVSTYRYSINTICRRGAAKKQLKWLFGSSIRRRRRRRASRIRWCTRMRTACITPSFTTCSKSVRARVKAPRDNVAYAY